MSHHVKPVAKKSRLIRMTGPTGVFSKMSETLGGVLIYDVKTSCSWSSDKSARSGEKARTRSHNAVSAVTNAVAENCSDSMTERNAACCSVVLRLSRPRVESPVAYCKYAGRWRTYAVGGSWRTYAAGFRSSAAPLAEAWRSTRALITFCISPQHLGDGTAGEQHERELASSEASTHLA